MPSQATALHASCPHHASPCVPVHVPTIAMLPDSRMPETAFVTAQAQRLTEFFLAPGRSFPQLRPQAASAGSGDGLGEYQSEALGYPRGADSDGGFDDDKAFHESGWGDVDFGGDALMEAPSKVSKVSISYAQASKQVWAHVCAGLGVLLGRHTSTHAGHTPSMLWLSVGEVPQ